MPLLVGGEFVHSFVNPQTQTWLSMPPQLRTLLQDFAAGTATLDLRLGTWDEPGREARTVRQSVFVLEQQIPAEMEQGAVDASRVRDVAHHRLSQVGFSSIRQASQGSAAWQLRNRYVEPG
jgi:hypothetical protein